MKITLNNKEEIELSEREKQIWSNGFMDGKKEAGFFIMVVISTVTFLIFVITLFSSCSAPQQFTTVQDFHENKAISAQYNAPDTLTLIHKYKWKNGQIISVQDMRKDSLGKWKPYGEWYAAPDSLDYVTIHGFVKN